MVLVDAREAVVAIAHLRDDVGSNLERRNWRALANFFRHDLIHRDPELEVASLGTLGARATEERGPCRRMIPTGDRRVSHFEIADDRQVIEIWGESRQRRRQLADATQLARNPGNR